MTQEEVYKKYFNIGLQICKKYFDKDKAFDICQDAFINNVLPSLDRFRGEGSFEGFVKRIITNCCISEYRKSKHQFVSDDVLKYTKTEDEYQDPFKNPEVIKKALELVEKLPPMYKKVFKMYTIDGMKHKEIAAKLGITDSTSKTNYMKAKITIQKMLEKEPILFESRRIKFFDQWNSLMKYLPTYEIFSGYIDKKAMSNVAPKSIGYIKEPVEIRFDIEKISHVRDRQYRHYVDDIITNDDIIESIEKATEQITIALMQDQFNIYQEEDNYPTKGVKAGEPNRFVIRNKTTNLNVVCQLEPGENEFTLTVITVMKKADFRAYPGQYVVTIK